MFSRENVPPVIFCFALLWCYPALLWGGRYFEHFRLFGHGALTLLAVLLMLWSVERLREIFMPDRALVRNMMLMAVPAILVTLLHYYQWRGNLDLLLNGLYWIAIPVFGALYAKEFRRILPVACMVPGAANLIYLCIEYVRHVGPFGITGNWNWSISLSVLAGASLAYRLRPAFWWIGAIAGWALYLPFGLEYLSRGGTAALILALAVALLLQFRRTRRLALPVILVGAVAGLVLLIALSVNDTDRNRRDLATAGATLLKEHFWNGVGPGRFESASPEVLPIEYHQSSFAAERHPHPHNEILHFGAELGIPGLLLFAVYGWILWRFLRRKESASGAEDAYLLFLPLLLTLHGQVDVLLAQWPLDTLWLLGIGTLWGIEISEEIPAKPLPPAEETPMQMLWTVRILCAAGLLYFLLLSGVSGFFERQARLAQLEDRPAYDLYLCSTRWKATPFNLYASAAIALYDRKDPALALDFLRRIPAETTFENYLHNRALTGRALAAQQKFSEAIPELEAELRNFPASRDIPPILETVRRLSVKK